MTEAEELETVIGMAVWAATNYASNPETLAMVNRVKERLTTLPETQDEQVTPAIPPEALPDAPDTL